MGPTAASCARPRLQLWLPSHTHTNACPLTGRLLISIPNSLAGTLLAACPRWLLPASRQFSERPSRAEDCHPFLLPRRLGAQLAATASCHPSITFPQHCLLIAFAAPCCLSQRAAKARCSCFSACQPLVLAAPESTRLGYPQPPICLSCLNTVAIRYPKDDPQCHRHPALHRSLHSTASLRCALTCA